MQERNTPMHLLTREIYLGLIKYIIILIWVKVKKKERGKEGK